MNKNRDTDIHVPVLTRVEGEGALDIKIRGGKIEDLKLRIFEPPRLFEKLLEGRSYNEVVDIVARICGICPVAYQMSAVSAIESIFDLTPTPWVQAMRRVMYCGEWIESHSLHIHLLAAPDYLGFNSAPEMAQKFPEEVRRGLKLQAVGNEIIRLFGGRSVHPIGVRVGGFYRAPESEEVVALCTQIRACLNDAKDLIQWTAELPLPNQQQDFTSVVLRHENEYAINQGRIVSDNGLDIAIDEFEQHFVEQQVPHSTALHCYLNDKPYLVGPLARININRDLLPTEINDIVESTGITFPSKNMFHSIVARAIEIYYAFTEALRLLEAYQADTNPYIEPDVSAGTGFGCTEAPRGILWHRYSLDDSGRVKESIIVPPTSQNQARIEEDIHQALTEFGLEKTDDELRLHGEMIIRNYDPCISCATHFLNFTADRE